MTVTRILKIKEINQQDRSMAYTGKTDSPAPGEEIYSNTHHLRQMLQAVDAVISGSMSQREAAKTFNIPRSTLRCHLPRLETYKHKLQKNPSNSRGKAILSKKEEKDLIDFAINMYRCGFGRTRKDFMLKIQETLNQAERKTKFDNNMPTDEWFSSFLDRHKDEMKECIIHYGSDVKGLVPADVLGVNQAVIEEVVHTVDPTAAGGAITINDVSQQHFHNQHIEISGDISPNTYHQITVQQSQHQLPASLGGHAVQVQIQDPVHDHLLQQQHHHQQQYNEQHYYQSAGIVNSNELQLQQQQQQQQQIQMTGQLQQTAQHVYIQRPTATTETASRCRTLPFSFNM